MTVFCLVFASSCHSSEYPPVPLVLRPSIEAHSLSFATGPRLVVALGDQGAALLDGSGKLEPLQLPGGRVDEIETLGSSGWLVRGGRRARFHPVDGGALHAAPDDVVSVAASCDGQTILVRDTSLSTWTPGQAARPHGPNVEGLLGAQFVDCDHTMAWTHDAVFLIDSQSAKRVASVRPPIHAATWRHPRSIMVAHDSPPRLTEFLITEDHEIRDHGPLPGVPRDIRFGIGGLLPVENLYLAEQQAITYTRPRSSDPR